MDYKYTQAHESYEMYAAGGVFYSAPGLTAFPVRLAVEIFRRCQAIRAAQGAHNPAVVYDPCCGGAYHLATMAYFNWDQIAGIYASDIDEDAVGVAARNLSLLTLDGMDRRIAELVSLRQQFDKKSHVAALHNARTLKQRLSELSHDYQVETHVFRTDATDGAAVESQLDGTTIDVVLTDVPYGQGSSWHASLSTHDKIMDPVYQLLDALLPHLAATAVVAVAAAKKDRIAHGYYKRVAKINVGRRQVVLLRQQQTHPRP